MKILMINKFYYVQGGVERYMFDLTEILEQHGHTVIPFSMKHQRNRPSPYEKYFVEHIDFTLSSPLTALVKGLKIVGRVIYSFHAKKRLKQLLKEVQPDIAHLHMIDHQISPSILHVLKKHSIPVVQTVHQCKLFCPSYLCYIAHKNEICERCVSGRFYHAVIQRCHKHSFWASLLVYVESTFHRLIGIYDIVRKFHVPSLHMEQMLKKAGIEKNRISHHFLTIDIEKYPHTGGYEDYYVYFGRLSTEKGVRTLLRAIKESGVKTPCYLIGEGPQRSELEKYVKIHQLTQVRFLGYKEKEELKRIVARAMFVVVPSECYDNSPVTIDESYAMGKPVIGSRTGGIPEFINDGDNGYLVEMGNAAQLAERIKILPRSPETIELFSKRVRRFAEENFTPQAHYEFIRAFYKSAL